MLDIFYKDIILEASKGSIDCYFTYNIIFSTKIDELGIDIKSSSDNDNLVVPTLNIKDVNMFNMLLSEYCELALEFYDDSNFDDDVVNSNNYDYYKTKAVLSLLWANASISDFDDPISFLRKRINFIKGEYSNELVNLGYSDILNGELVYKINKSNIIDETPYVFDLSVVGENGSYSFPSVDFGISDDCLYVYAIQNGHDRNDNNSFCKSINRKLYKVNAGTESLDITHSFLYAFNALVQVVGSVDKVVVPNFLVSRWNSKEIANSKKALYMERKGLEYSLEDEVYKHDKIQYNLTDKLMNILVMFEDLYTGVSFNVLGDNPNMDSSLNMEYPLYTNNKLLSDFNELISVNKMVK